MSKELLFSITKKDFNIDWFSGSGAGGQYRNKHQNCCRLTHIESGLTATGTRSRSRKQNLTESFKSLVSSKEFERWLKRKAVITSINLEELERKVDDLMDEKNIKIEYL